MDVYLDNAATSHPKPEAVYSAVNDVLRGGGSANRAGHDRGMGATRRLFEVREALADFLGAPDSSRVVFTANGTDALNLALKGYLRSGDHVVTTDVEHNAVVRPLHALATRAGVRVTRVAAERDGRIDPPAILQALEPDTRLVVCTHASNVLGAVVDIASLGHALRKRGVPLLVDAAQTLGYINVDVVDMGIAMLAAPGHKGLLGPQGTGLLYVREDIALATWREGGTGTESSRAEMPEAMPERLEAGTHNLPGIAGLGAAVAWLRARGVDRIHTKKRAHVTRLIDALGADARLRIVSATEATQQSSLVSFTVDGVDSQRIAGALGQRGIAVRGGLHCAPGAHAAADTGRWGAVRVSPGVFTEEDDISVFLHTLGEVLDTCR